MIQVVQAATGGPVRLVDVPVPTAGPTEVLVKTVASLISPGTERAVTALAQASLMSKARARPDLVRQVMKKARTDGIGPTARAVRARLGEDVPLGYSAAGIAIEVGEYVSGVSPGDVVATGGAGHANHAEFQAVPGLLCVPLPEGVAAEDAAFATVASIAAHGLRLADVGPGGRVVVIGLGLIGQLTLRLAQAAGCITAGIDVAEYPVERAKASGSLALLESGQDTTTSVLDWSNGRGADAVIVTAAAASSDVMRRAPALCRDRATVVVVGDVGLHLERAPLYEKELTLRFARSYGPGRYERTYEEWAVDYPVGFVRWTEGRNVEAILDLSAAGRLAVSDLVTHRFPIEGATAAYELIEARCEPHLGVLLTYPSKGPPQRSIRITTPAAARGGAGIGLIGAGAFASTVLVPALKATGFHRLVSVASSSGVSARRLAEQAGFDRAVSGADAVISDPQVDVVVIATPHDSHASLTTKALRAGKHVFCEKPLATSVDDLHNLEAAWHQSGRVLFVGYNRRWSRTLPLIRDHFSVGSEPLVITYRINAGTVPANHWYHDRRQGGRLIGEVCHFIDTCAAIIGEAAVDVHAVGTTNEELALADNVVVTLRYRGGSLGTISYASNGPPEIEKERLDILGRGRAATVIDFANVLLNGKPIAVPSGKGHVEEMAAFQLALQGDGPAQQDAISSTLTTLLAVRSLSGILTSS